MTGLCPIKSKMPPPPDSAVKHPLKIMVQGAFGALAVSELHVVDCKKRINSEYYQTEILEKFSLSALTPNSSEGTISSCKIVPLISESILMQDNAPSHASKSTEKLCSDHLSLFLDERPTGNGPDLNLIENMWQL
uniref:Putative LOC101238723 [Hydra vulgaris] n=1 Tax=Lepeophtheirus salmonis TaxID=72036 RepID=A0A0K2T5A2_LEPSM